MKEEEYHSAILPTYLFGFNRMIGANDEVKCPADILEKAPVKVW